MQRGQLPTCACVDGVVVGCSGDYPEGWSGATTGAASLAECIGPPIPFGQCVPGVAREKFVPADPSAPQRPALALAFRVDRVPVP